MITSHMNGFVQEDSTQVKGHRERAVDCPGEESSRIKSLQGSTHMARIQHYQEELRKRRDEDSRDRVDLDLNASLKLKKLSENPKVGIDNPTFEGKEKARTISCPQDHVAGELQWGVEIGQGVLRGQEREKVKEMKGITKGLKGGG